jgi:undecaprenyl-diphosphatase
MARLLVASLGHIDRFELGICRYINRSSNVAAVRKLFSVISWLGNGWFWYALIAFVLLRDLPTGTRPAGHMLITGAVGVAIYKLIKEVAVRERPFISDTAINCACAPLDRYSFPSGHTLHAVSFTLMLTHYSPTWWPYVTVFAVLVAISRVVLGLHYPTDVAAGALLGGGLATLSLGIGESVLL